MILRLRQRGQEKPEGLQWQKLQSFHNDGIETGSMSECVSLVYIDGPAAEDVRGYHAGGSILWAPWDEIKTAADRPFTKMITVMGGSREVDDSERFGTGVGTEVLKVIKKCKFQNIQWEFYKSSNAHISRYGVVTDLHTKQRLPLLRVFISKIAPGLDGVTVDDTAFTGMKADPMSRPLPPPPVDPKSRRLPPPPLRPPKRA